MVRNNQPGSQRKNIGPLTYCWWLKSQTTTWDVWNPINKGIKLPYQLVSRILPSTVPQDLRVWGNDVFCSPLKGLRNRDLLKGSVSIGHCCVGSPDVSLNSNDSSLDIHRVICWEYERMRISRCFQCFRFVVHWNSIWGSILNSKTWNCFMTSFWKDTTTTPFSWYRLFISSYLRKHVIRFFWKGQVGGSISSQHILDTLFRQSHIHSFLTGNGLPFFGYFAW